MIFHKNFTDHIQLCIPHPYVFLFEANISLSEEDGFYVIKSSNRWKAYYAACLSNYNITYHKATRIFVLKGQPFASTPVNLTRPWEESKSLSILNHALSELKRLHRFLDLLVVGIIAAIFILTTTSIAVAAFTHII